MKEGGKEGVKWHVVGRRVGDIFDVWHLRGVFSLIFHVLMFKALPYAVSSVRVVPLIVYSVEGDYYYHFKLLRATMGL